MAAPTPRLAPAAREGAGERGEVSLRCGAVRAPHASPECDHVRLGLNSGVKVELAALTGHAGGLALEPLGDGGGLGCGLCGGLWTLGGAVREQKRLRMAAATGSKAPRGHAGDPDRTFAAATSVRLRRVCSGAAIRLILTSFRCRLASPAGPSIKQNVYSVQPVCLREQTARAGDRRCCPPRCLPCSAGHGTAGRAGVFLKDYNHKVLRRSIVPSPQVK